MSNPQTRKKVSVKKTITRKRWKSLISTDFMNNTFKNMTLDEAENVDGKIEYMRHQKLVRKFMGSDTPYRGIILYHGLGSGKTCSSVLISEINKVNRKTVVFLPASLKDNYFNEIEKCSLYDVIDNKDGVWCQLENKKENLKLLKKFFNEDVLDKITQPDIWVCDSKKTPFLKDIDESKKFPYDNLNEQQKQQILDQNMKIKMLQYRIEHYDGLSRETIKDMQTQKALDNALVIVDEAHNLGSMMRNQKYNDTQNKGSIRGRLLYDLFMKCKNTRFIFLTGTPITSNPIELAYMYNVLRGPLDVFKIKLNTSDSSEKIKKVITEYKFFDFYKIFKTYVEVTKTPYGFSRDKDGFLKKEVNFPKTHMAWLKKIAEHFVENKLDIDLKDITTERNVCIPVKTIENKKEDRFRETFYNNQNTDFFMKRIMGLTSYYGGNEKDKSKYPRSIEHPVDEINMSFPQYVRYQDERMREIKIEENNKKKGKKNDDDDDDSIQTFRTRSRLVCNFVFPPQIEAEIEISDNEEETLNQAIISKLETWSKNLTDSKSFETLYDLSPKYNLIRIRIEECEGTSVVYSNFKNREGLYAFAVILKCYGWNQITLRLLDKKTDTWDILQSNPNSSKGFAIYEPTDTAKRSQELIRKIFNNEWNDLPKSLVSSIGKATNLRGEFIKTLLLSPRAAEGITLKNVRQMHVVEHFWSYIRTEQVIGRAVRMNSHIALPAIERQVDIYKYVTKFGEDLEKKIASNPKYAEGFNYIRDFDNFDTSDQIVFTISDKKYANINNFLTLVKQSSFDCAVNYKTKCLTQYPYDEYHPNFDQHLKNTQNNLQATKSKKIEIVLETKKLKKKWLPLKLQGKEVYFNKKTNEIFDKEIMNNQKPKLLGILLEDEKRFLKA